MKYVGQITSEILIIEMKNNKEYEGKKIRLRHSDVITFPNFMKF